MDRLDAMAVFVTVVEEGSLAAAARELGHSPATVTRVVVIWKQASASGCRIARPAPCG